MLCPLLSPARMFLMLHLLTASTFDGILFPKDSAARHHLMTTR